MLPCRILDVRTFPVKKLNVLVIFTSFHFLLYDSRLGPNSVSYDRTQNDSATRCRDDTPGYSHIWTSTYAQWLFPAKVPSDAILA